jgi:hypothetical protein
MQKLSNVIKSGWPDYKQDLDFELRQFWDHRDDLSLTDGIILKGQRIVIPHELQHQTLMKLHAAHQGMVRTKQLARDLVFWPGINSQIEDIVSRCASCQTFRNYQAKEPLIPLEAPSAPWSHIAIDLFTYDELKFVILVDYYSEWFEFEELSQTTAPKVINSVRKVFATHGIPQKVLTDNGPPFNSHTWSKFADDYGFAHITMSPKHSQTNGLVERAVGIVKSMLNKGPQDLTLALLNIRNTPHPTIGSPAQRLLGRRTRTVLPIQPDLLRPETLNPDAVQSAKTDQRNTAKQYYDRNAHELPTLKPGDSVRYRDENTKTWKPALLLPDRSQYPRSYQVVNPQGHVIRRNRRDLLKSNEPNLYHREVPEEDDWDISPTPNFSQPTATIAPQSPIRPVATPVPSQTTPLIPAASQQAPVPPQLLTRTGRLTEPPVKFKDYVKP